MQKYWHKQKITIEPGQFQDRFRWCWGFFFQTGCLKSLVLASLKPFLLQCLNSSSWLSFRAFIIIRYVWVMPLGFWFLFTLLISVWNKAILEIIIIIIHPKLVNIRIQKHFILKFTLILKLEKKGLDDSADSGRSKLDSIQHNNV